MSEFFVTPTVRGHCHVIVVEGDLDMTTAPALDEALDARPDGLPVVVDLTALTFIESAGLHVLLRERDLGLPAAIIRTPGSNIARVLDLVQVAKAIPLYGDVTEATKRLRAAS
jgi:anti-sigma B factor antagonist